MPWKAWSVRDERLRLVARRLDGDIRIPAKSTIHAVRRVGCLQQQAKLDAFERPFNNERPHEALNTRMPAEAYRPSTRPYAGLPELRYPGTTTMS
jgi:hypothetical protein